MLKYKVIEIFVPTDDFCISFQQHIHHYRIECNGQRHRNRKTEKYGEINFVDSTHIKVCHNKHIKQHKVFKEVAERGYTLIGWFYGFKLHLIINDRGEILLFSLTKGNAKPHMIFYSIQCDECFSNLFFSP